MNKHSTITPLPHTFCEGKLLAFRLGPRRELTLTVLVPLIVSGQAPAWSEARTSHIRFGAISNFAEVAEVLQPELQGQVIVNLGYHPNETSSTNRLVFRLKWMEDFAPLVVRCRNVKVWEDAPEVSL